MARVFKHRYADGHVSPKWYIEYRDHTGRKRRIAGFIDKRATEQEAARLEREAEQIRAGLLPPQTPQLARTITEHIADYERALVAKGTKLATAALVRHRLQAVADGCGWSSLHDLSPDSARAWLSQQQTGGKVTRRSMSAQTIAHYLTHLVAFGAWCMPKRLAVNPFAGVEKPQASADRRHIRRVISASEFRRLIDTTRADKRRYCLDGPDRAALYLVAAYTGLRASECAALRREDVSRDSVTLGGQHTKNGQAATIPIPPWVAAELAPWLDGQSGLLWPGNWAANRMGGKWLQGDLARAGIDYRDAAGRVFDFHALRCYYAVELLLSGVPLVAVQKLMRHSTPTLTANIYAQLGLGDLAAEVGKMRAA